MEIDDCRKHLKQEADQPVCSFLARGFSGRGRKESQETLARAAQVFSVPANTTTHSGGGVPREHEAVGKPQAALANPSDGRFPNSASGIWRTNWMTPSPHLRPISSRYGSSSARRARRFACSESFL